MSLRPNAKRSKHSCSLGSDRWKCGKRLICAAQEEKNNKQTTNITLEYWQKKIEPDREKIVFSENRWKPRPNVNAWVVCLFTWVSHRVKELDLWWLLRNHQIITKQQLRGQFYVPNRSHSLSLSHTITFIRMIITYYISFFATKISKHDHNTEHRTHIKWNALVPKRHKNKIK